MKSLEEFLQASAASHARLCPRQVLGVRMGLLAGRLLQLDLPRTDKRLLTIVETDGCVVDGLAAVTGCRVGRRTLRVEDYGKVGATCVDTHTGMAVRIVPSIEARILAAEYAPEARNHWEAQLIGYQHMPDDLLLAWQRVVLLTSLAEIVGQPGTHVTCDRCHEEIINQREVVQGGLVLCRACAGQAYYLLSLERQATVPACCESLV
jgi:formylmethanofuran dehydrogenase subunit E